MWNRWKPNVRNPYSTIAYPKVRTAPRLTLRRSRTGVKTRTRKRTYYGKRKRNTLKRSVWRMKKKLRLLPTLQKDLILDQVPDRWTSVQGQSQWQSGGNLTTKNTVNTGWILSPHSMNWLLFSIPSIDSISSFYRGRSKFILHSWELITRMTNLGNCPCEMECYTLKAKKKVNVLTDTDEGMSTTQTFNDFLARQFAAQYGTNSVATPGYGPNHAGFKLTDVNRVLEYFKIVRHKRRVIQPGEALRIRKYGTRPRTFDSAQYYNANGSDLTGHLPKGGLAYVYRHQGIPQSQESKTATDVTLCDTALDVVHTLHVRISVVPYSRYDAVATPGQLSTGQTIKLIFPGTSAAGTQVPAT